MKAVFLVFFLYSGCLLGAASSAEEDKIDPAQAFAIVSKQAGLRGVKVIAECFEEEKMALFAVMDDDVPYGQSREGKVAVSEYIGRYLPGELKVLAKTKQQPVQLLREALHNVNEIFERGCVGNYGQVMPLYNMQLLFI